MLLSGVRPSNCLSTFRHLGPKQTLRQTGHSHQSLWILAMDEQPRFILEKRFDDFNQLHADLKEIEPGMCAAVGFGGGSYVSGNGGSVFPSRMRVYSTEVGGDSLIKPDFKKGASLAKRISQAEVRTDHQKILWATCFWVLVKVQKVDVFPQ